MKIFGKKKEEEPGPTAEGSGPEPSQEAKHPVETKAPPRYRREGDKYIFPAKEVPLWRPPEPEPEPPEGDDILPLGKLPLDKITELLQEFPRSKKNKDGIRFAGCQLRVRLRDGTTLQGWLSEKDYHQFRVEGLIRGWRDPRVL